MSFTVRDRIRERAWQTTEERLDAGVVPIPWDSAKLEYIGDLRVKIVELAHHEEEVVKMMHAMRDDFLNRAVQAETIVFDEGSEWYHDYTTKYPTPDYMREIMSRISTTGNYGNGKDKS